MTRGQHPPATAAAPITPRGAARRRDARIQQGGVLHRDTVVPGPRPAVAAVVPAEIRDDARVRIGGQTPCF